MRLIAILVKRQCHSLSPRVSGSVDLIDDFPIASPTVCHSRWPFAVEREHRTEASVRRAKEREPRLRRGSRGTLEGARRRTMGAERREPKTTVISEGQSARSQARVIYVQHGSWRRLIREELAIMKLGWVSW